MLLLFYKILREVIHEKRLTITLSDSVLENLEKMAKEMGLSKSAMISVALENYKKGQVK